MRHLPPTSLRRHGVAVLAVLLVAVPALAVTACGGSDGSSGAGGGPAAPDDTASSVERERETVTIELIAFEPERLTVAPGTVVRWLQTDPGVHTVTSGKVLDGSALVTTTPDGTFDSGGIATGKTFDVIFDTTGTFPYFCSIHPATMRGEVQVR